MSARPLRIGIDLRFTASSHMGTGSYAEQGAFDLVAARRPGDVVIGFTDGDPFTGPLADGVVWRRVPRVLGSDPTGIAQRLLWDSAIAHAEVDVFWAPTGLAPLVPTSPVAITLHDLHVERHPEWFEPALRNQLQRELRRSANQADLVIAISEWTRQDVAARFGVPQERLRVLHQGLHRRFATRPTGDAIVAALGALGVQAPYLLALSNHAPHKNTEFAIAAFAAWIRSSGNASHRLVIAGGGPAPKAPIDLTAAITRHGVAERVSVLGRVADEHLTALYAGAAAFLFPSLSEGWGLPPLEAIAMGTPVIASNGGALPEAIGDAGQCLPVTEPGLWAKALTELLRDGPPSAMLATMAQRTAALLAPRQPDLRDLLGSIARAGESQRPAPMRAAISALSTSAATALPSPALRLSGCMIIKNGVRLGYPFVEAILAVIDQVDEMVVVDGESEDGTWPMLEAMAGICPTLRIERWPWPATTRGGRVIAEATNHALTRCRGRHILNIQADEIHTEANLVRLRELLDEGYDCAAMPFLHFRSSWWTILANPAYDATIRCVPNRPGVASVDDGTTFRGPVGRCAPPDAFPDMIFHVGWVYAPNIIAKHQNHAAIYSDHADYQRKAERASQASAATTEEVARIDDEYELLRFRGRHPPVIAHLLQQPAYDPAPGLALWQQRFRSTATAGQNSGAKPRGVAFAAGGG